MRHVLVTGGCGFIGSNYVHHLLDETDAQITVLDKFTYAGRRENLRERWGNARLSLVIGDIANSELVAHVLHTRDIDTIVNFAAETHVDRSIREPMAFTQTNVLGTHVLLEAVRKFDLRFHQVGTDEVYGSIPLGSQSTERDLLLPSSPYSASKAAADQLVLAYHITFGCRVTVTRGANNVGPYQFPEKALPLFVTRALDDRPIPVYGDGLQRRDYTHVHDHCCAITTILTKGTCGEVYNVGTGQDVSNLEMLATILDTIGKPATLIQHVEDRPGHDRRYSMSISKLTALGWKPSHAPLEAIQFAARWYRDNRWWWTSLREQGSEEEHRSPCISLARNR